MAKESMRKLQAEQSKAKLLAVALELIEKYGYDAIGIDQICEKAEMSVGAFYHHFKSKAHIIIEGYAPLDQYFKETVTTLVADSDPVEQVISCVLYIMKYAQNRGLDLVTQVYKAQITEANTFFISADRDIFKTLCELIEQAQAKGSLKKDTPAGEICREILILARGIVYNWCQSEGGYDIEQTARRMVENYLAAYRQPL